MDANAIVNEIGKINANIQAWESECSKLHYHLSKYEDSIVQGKTRLDELWTRLRATLDAKDETAKPQTDDTPQTDDDAEYAIVKQTVKIIAVGRCNDHPSVNVIARNIETGTELRLFTNQKSLIETCFNGFGKKADVEFESSSGKLLGVSVCE